MAKGKGVSFAEKQRRLHRSIRDSNTFCNFKEIESFAKMAGIIPQATKEVLQALLDDNLVLQDRIGSQNIYWSLACNAGLMLQQSLQTLTERKNAAHATSEQYEVTLEAWKADPEARAIEPDEAAEATEMQARIDQLKQEIGQLQEKNPLYLRTLEEDAKIAQEAASRWADNVSGIRQWIKHRTGESENEINKQFDIPSDIDDDI